MATSCREGSPGSRRGTETIGRGSLCYGDLVLNGVTFKESDVCLSDIYPLKVFDHYGIVALVELVKLILVEMC